MDNTLSPPKKRSFARSVLLFVCIIFSIVAFLFVWNEFLSPHAREAREAKRNYAAYEAWEQTYNQALAQDTYGGKTPEETLELFRGALEKDDVELASKYFMLDAGLSRQKWVEWLTKIKDDGNLQKFVQDLRGAERGNSITNEDVGFILRNEDGTVGFGFRLKKINNPMAVIWKIEEM